MKAYFTASIAGKKYQLDNYHAVINYLESKGVEVVSDHIMQATESKIRMETKDERIKFQKTLESWINDCDLMVVEASFPSISVGYEIALALHRMKPVLVLYTEDPPSLINNNEEDKLVVEQYSPSSLHETIDSFLNYIRGAADMRFTFFITPELNSFLVKIARKQKIPKSVYLRHLIADDMKRNNQG